MKLTFRISAKRVFLTYAQCDELTKEEIYFTLAETYNIRKFMLGEETHQDGGRHIHAFLEFINKIDSKNVNCFDINTGTKQFHPNIKGVPRGKDHEERVLNYIQKEDLCPLTNIANKLTWGEIKDQAVNAEEYLKMVEKHYPEKCANNWDRLKSYAEQRFCQEDPSTITEFAPHEGFELPKELKNIQPSKDKCTIIIGRAGSGKTTWAKQVAKKPCLFLSHMDGLRKLTKKHKSIIFDDMCFTHLPIQGQKHILDTENPREIHLRYRTAMIPAGMQKIFTNNKYPFYNEGGCEHTEAIKRRTEVTFIN